MTALAAQATAHTPEHWGETLRAHGMRVTSGRVAALGYLQMHPHSSVADIHGALAGELPSLSQQSAHNIANDLTECGILRRIDLPDSGSARYEMKRGDNHHHVQCVVCQRIEDIDCIVGEAPCLRPEHTHGMRLLEAAITFRGVCADCESRLEPAAAGGAPAA
ncbi:Fur family transcriptional regulator [Leucobacter soli]|uniref:Transcriptional regulator FurA n=1 Tax=Leucobacter soli TaxID=2812850 RepID=A0A916NQ11_9MICO|nr:transcriptional repressor [Leucobacter soli]CAG7619291.1 Transcriptional regulator FurA [Leucobacter soli]